jgi:hypothetical protein
MRIIKLSKDDDSFRSAAEVTRFFQEELYERDPVGDFGVTPAKQYMPDIQKGTLLIFSYQTTCMFVGRAAEPMAYWDPKDKSFDPNWPASVVVDMPTLRAVDVKLHDFERALKKATGYKKSIVAYRGWAHIPDEHETFALKFFGGPLKKQSALDDLTPPEGNQAPNRVESTHSTYQRDPEVREFVINRARGRCEFCGKQGFLLPSGHRFLETHHIIALAKEGADTPQNVIALCPDHHREAHYGASGAEMESKMVNIIRRKAKTA